MRVIAIFGAVLALLTIGFVVGHATARAELQRKIRQEMEREGWSRSHHKIYLAAISVLNKIVRAHDLDAPMEFRVVQLPDQLRSDAQNVIDRYRKENSA